MYIVRIYIYIYTYVCVCVCVCVCARAHIHTYTECLKIDTTQSYDNNSSLRRAQW